MRVLPCAIACAAMVALSTPTGLDSCAIGPPIPLFVPVTRPANVSTFLSGRVGVLLRSYDKRYLIAAYRSLSGVPLTEAEKGALFPPPQPAADYPTYDSPSLTAWLSARKAVRGADPDVKVERYKTVPAKGAHYTFRNCQDAAFDTAVETLEGLRARWSGDDTRLLEWSRAQDQVFANCSGASPEPILPAEPTAETDAVIAKHRQYQIAAALLYAGRHRQASDAFRIIAADPESPWSPWGHYLSARALLRAGNLDGDLDAFREGKAELLAIIQDPAQSDWHPTCLDLLHLWQIRVEPDVRLAELSAELMQPTEDDRSQSFTDFLYLIGRPNRVGEPAMMERQTATGELAAWMVAMSGVAPPSAGALSPGYWKKTRNSAWLVAALINAPASDLPPLLDAARRIPPSAPAYESVVYYSLTREIGRGNRSAARQWADGALRRNLLRSTRNLILQERTRIAADWTEFLRFSLRRNEPIVFFDGAEVEAHESANAAPVFDADVITAFNNALPLSLWTDASRNPLLPPPMQLRVAEAGWMRALVLDDLDTAERLMERVVELAPTAVGASAFLEAADRDEARRAALFIVLRTPSLRPLLPSSDQSTPNLASARYVAADAYGLRTGCWNTGPDQKFARSIDFLTPAQRAAAQVEVKKLQAAEPWESAFLLRATLEWARAKPDDPRVPEALHRAVMSARYRCTSEKGSRHSREAFALLHRRYSKSPWAARTKYWY